MSKKYYLDTSIYIDYYENRSDKFRPLGDWAHMLLSLIECNGDVLIISDILIEELNRYIKSENVFQDYKGQIEKIEFTRKQLEEARKFATERKVPLGDALHAIIARDSNAVLVARDKHFEKLRDICESKKPEEII